MHPIENIIESSIDRIKRMTDVNTVIGEAITAADGTLLLPVSRVSLGFAVGGGEYGGTEASSRCRSRSESPADADSRYPFTGAATVGMSLKPLAFLSVEQGNVRVIPAAPESAVDKLADLVPQFIKGMERILSAAVDKTDKKCENKMGRYRGCCPTSQLKVNGTEESFDESCSE
jgi:sporulation protein YtfJ